MFKRLLIIAALINLCFVSVSFAAENGAQKTKDTKPAELVTFGDFLQTSTKDIKNFKVDLSGAYISVPPRCRKCHKVAKKGSYNLTNMVEPSDDSCDWCHNGGAASMFIISMDNGDFGETGYGVGHSRGFAVDTGRWRAPDDTYPAFTPKFWRGGMSCLDCHPAHDYSNQTFSHTEKVIPFSQTIDVDITKILKLNPDRKIDAKTGMEVIGRDWGKSTFGGPQSTSQPNREEARVAVINRTCIDCHEGDAGLHNSANLVYSEDNALHGKIGLDCYIQASTHDSRPDRCAKEIVFNPEDGKNYGPDCRGCHSGSSDCDICHSLSKISKAIGATLQPSDSDNLTGIGMDSPKNILANIECSPDCMSLGLSWPHRTLGWKMLKDELFGIDFDGREIKVGQIRRFSVEKISLIPKPAQDLDSVCLDCHNSAVWNPGSKEPLMRGLP